MRVRESTPTSSTPDRDGERFELRAAADARRLFAPLIHDGREREEVAAEFYKLGRSIAGRDADHEQRQVVYRSYYEQIVSDPRARADAQDDKSADIARTLAAMRAENLHLRSTPEAHRAHVEIDSYNTVTDNLRALYEPSEGRTRAEHASHLNLVSQDARDLFERGATLHGDVLSVPREAVGKPDRADQIRIGTHEHAVREFIPLIGEEAAKSKAAEFVELGRQIAGRTSDGDTRLVVFQTFHREITRDPATGKSRTREEQAAQIELTLERMRTFARAMSLEEWQRDPVEFVPVEDWEREREARQHDAEHETHGRLTYHIEHILGLDLDGGEHVRDETPEREHANDGRETIGGQLPSVEYERMRLDHLPPHLPDGLSEVEEQRLRYEIIPRIDRQLAVGTRPTDIIRSLYADELTEEARDHDRETARLFTSNVHGAIAERPLTRAEEFRALYTLQALTSQNTAPEHNRAVAAEIERRAPTPRERADAITAVGARLAGVYRAEVGRLKSFEAAEEARDRLADETLRHEQTVRASPEFRRLLIAERDDEQHRRLAEREALIRGNKGYTDNAGQSREVTTYTSSYPELVGETRPPSAYARLREEHERERSTARAELARMLLAPELERARAANVAEIERHQEYYRRAVGASVTTASEARSRVEPQLALARATLSRLHDERAALGVEPLRPKEHTTAPLFVGSPDGKLRLPVESINEYKTLTGVAREMKISTRAYASPRGREVTGASEERAAVYDFARDYVRFRLLDETTRLRNESRLYREFGDQLDGARNVEELRLTINDVRRGNYARAREPERFAGEAREAQSRGEQTRRPLSESEIVKLLLAPAPPHYTDEMRELRSSRSASGRDRAEHIRRLERGEVAPSPALVRILGEFDRTRHGSPAHHVHNIKAFLGDYLNPPTPDRNRFSAENLYELGRRLTPAERDHVFKLVSDTKDRLAAGVKVRAVEPSGRHARASELNPSAIERDDEPKADRTTNANIPRDSPSFLRYYGAATWREAESLSVASSRLADGRPLDPESATVLSGVPDHDLETIATLLAEFRSKPTLLKAATSYLNRSDETHKRQLGSIVETFGAMRVTPDERGQLRFQITAPTDSELSREHWAKLLDHYSSRLIDSQPARLPDTQRRDIRRAALTSAWDAIEPQTRITSSSGEFLPVRDSHETERAIEYGKSLQERARLATDSLEASADRAITPHDRQRHGLLVAYAARTKAEYLENFCRIDEHAKARARGTHSAHGDNKEAQVAGRNERFGSLRDDMEERVTAYLTAVVRTGGEASLRRDASRHTEAVSRHIRDALRAHGHESAAFDLDDRQINSISTNLIAELPSALRESRARDTEGHQDHRRSELSLRDVPSSVHAPKPLVLDAYTTSAAGRPVQLRTEHTRLDCSEDEYVEQKVSRTFHAFQEPPSRRTQHVTPEPQHSRHDRAAPEMNADAREQHAHTFTLTR